MALVAPAIVDALDEARRRSSGGVAAPGGRAAGPRARAAPGACRRQARRLARRAVVAGRPRRAGPARPAHPDGAQRALSVLRRFVDEAGARRRGYVRLMTEAPALAAPDQAVVAAFERIDVVIADPIREIIARRVDPDRALADHVFAHRLLARAGTRVLVPAGPLLVAPDLARGVPSDPATRAGRALAMQLLAVALARRGGLPPRPSRSAPSPTGSSTNAGHRPGPPRRSRCAGRCSPSTRSPSSSRRSPRPRPSTWHALVAALLADAGDVDVILRRPLAPGAPTLGMTRAAANVAAGLRRSRVAPVLSGAAADHAGRAVAAADAALASLEEHGWRAVVDQPLGMDGAHPGGLAVAERTETFDPLTAGEAGRITDPPTARS